MEKVWIEDLNYNKDQDFNYRNDKKDHNKLFRLDNGDYLKVFPFQLLNDCKVIIEDADYNLEHKILASDNSNAPKEIVRPKYAVYRDKKLKIFKGYVMDKATGNFYTPETILRNDQDAFDLHRYAEIYTKLENVVKEANQDGIIIPDLCTTGNIILTNSSGDVKLIDYDGMQIDNYGTRNYSKVYCYQVDYFYPKYHYHNLYTDNIDKKSLFLIYLFNTFEITPDKIDDLTLQKDAKELFDYLGIVDEEIKNKMGLYFNNKKDNDYLDSTVNDIADNYNIEFSNRHVKKLIKK